MPAASSVSLTSSESGLRSPGADPEAIISRSESRICSSVCCDSSQPLKRLGPLESLGQSAHRALSNAPASSRRSSLAEFRALPRLGFAAQDVGSAGLRFPRHQPVSNTERDCLLVEGFWPRDGWLISFKELFSAC